MSITMTVLTVGLLFAAGALPDRTASVRPTTQQIVVREGQTLQSVTNAVSDGENLLAATERIRQLNGLEGLAGDAVLPTGLVLMVPAG